MARPKASEPRSEVERPDLTVAINQLAQEILDLRETIDEFRQDFAWMLNNREEFRCQRELHVMHVTSMPKDPCAPDFGKRVNQYSAKDLPSDDEQPSEEDADDNEQGTLW